MNSLMPVPDPICGDLRRHLEVEPGPRGDKLRCFGSAGDIVVTALVILVELPTRRS